MRIAECWAISFGNVRGTRSSSSKLVPVPNRMAVLSIVALESINEARDRTFFGEMMMVLFVAIYFAIMLIV